MAAKKTIGQKKAERDRQLANVVTTAKAGGDRIDAIINKMRKAGDGSSRIMRSSEIEKREYARRYSGILALDVVLNGGLPKGALVEFGGPYSSGKAQPRTSQVLTPAGFVDIGTLRVGDSVIGSDGLPHRVTGVFPQGEKTVFRVSTTDGASTLCCGEHLWFTQTVDEAARGLPGRVRSLFTISSTLKRTKGTKAGFENHRLPVAAPVELSPRGCTPLHPWLLGALLGDGNFTNNCVVFCKPEEDVMLRVSSLLPKEDTAIRFESEGKAVSLRIKKAQRNNRVSCTRQALEALGLAGLKSHEKFIPEPYLFASVQDRLELLRGLCDTDGYVSGSRVEFYTSSQRLRDDVLTLSRSLGALVSVSERVPRYSYAGLAREGRLSYRLSIYFPNGLCPVSSNKHLASWRGVETSRRYYRSVRSVEPAGVEDCVCISVDAPDQLYVTDDFLVTHNTTLALHCCANEQRTGGGAVCWVALEPFSKRWARQNGFFIPFSEDVIVNAQGEEEAIDSYESATPIELQRMQEAGIEDPYTEVSPFVLIQEERGDVALDLALEAISSNEFAYVVVDSVGVAKNTKFFTDKGVQESGDFPREPKMLADYTARCLLMFNRKYDENNQPSKDGTRFNDTTVININQIVTAIGTSAYAPWKQHEMKGGEGMKHNHHAVVFVWRTQRDDQKIDAPGGRKAVIAQQVNLYGLKSKIGPPFIQTDFDLYLQDHGDFSAGSIDHARDLLTFAVLTGHVERAGAWYTIGEQRFNGRAPAEQYLRENPDVYVDLYPQVLNAMRK